MKIKSRSGRKLKNQVNLKLRSLLFAITVLVGTIFITLLFYSKLTQSLSAQTITDPLIESDATVNKYCSQFKKCIFNGGSPSQCNVKTVNLASPCETKTHAEARHAKIANIRKRRLVMSHRGSTEFAPENTLASYLATLQLGANGNEMDIRKSKDGILIMFHDDMTDRLLINTFGKIDDYSYAQIKEMKMVRDGGGQKKYGCIPTLLDTLLLHMQNNGLLYLDLKDTSTENTVISYLNTLDMWDNLVAVDPNNAPQIASNPKYNSPIKGYRDLLNNRDDVNFDVLKKVVEGTDNFFVVDDPRGITQMLGRTIGNTSLSSTACFSNSVTPTPNSLPENQLINIILYAPHWDQIPQNDSEKIQFADEIMNRGHAINDALKLNYRSQGLIDALNVRINNRSIHSDWMFHGLDAQEAMRALPSINATDLPKTFREVLWKADQSLLSMTYPGYPVSHLDWRLKQTVWTAALAVPGTATEDVIKEYLNLTDSAAWEIGPTYFEPAAETLMRISPQKSTARQLLRHRRADVKGRTILELLRYAGRGEQWACDVLKNQEPYAKSWIVFQPDKSCVL